MVRGPPPACLVHPPLTRTDVDTAAPRMLDINVDDTWNALLAREDTDGNVQITVEDLGPKVPYLLTLV